MQQNFLDNKILYCLKKNLIKMWKTTRFLRRVPISSTSKIFND